MIPDYKYIDDEETTLCHLQITSGKYAGLRYHYGKVGIKENENDQPPTLKFKYTVVDNPNDVEYNQELIDVLGDILVEILDEELQVREEI